MSAKPFAYAQLQHTHALPPAPYDTWRGHCLVFVRSCFGVNSLYPSAAKAWEGAKFKHYTSDSRYIPRGVPVFWVGGSEGYGHIALSRGDGTVWTTDFVRSGQVDVADIDDITRKWGLRLVGWTEDLNGVRVYTPPAPPVKAPVTPVKAPSSASQVSYGKNFDNALAAAQKAAKANKGKNPAKFKAARSIINAVKGLRKSA